VKRKYIKPSPEAIASAIKIPGLSLLERILAAEMIAFTDKLVEKLRTK
jgi:hypothetical protein